MWFAPSSLTRAGLSTSPIPKLFIDAPPGGFLIGAQRNFCLTWPNQDATARFVAKVLAGQIA